MKKNIPGLCALVLALAIGFPALAESAVTPSEPAATPAPQPETTPAPQPVGLLIEISGENDTLMQGGWYMISITSQKEEIEFIWQEVEGAQLYALELLDSENELVTTGETTETKLKIPAEKVLSGRYTLRVAAKSAWETLLEGEIVFQLGMGGQMGQGMGQMMGGGQKGGMSGQMGDIQQEQGLKITPGESLTDSHSSGTKSLLAFGAVEKSAAEDEMEVLCLGGEELEISLAEGGAFKALIKENTLELASQQQDACWQINLRALDVLKRSGIDLLVLDGEELETSFALEGALYGSLRAKGMVSGSFTLLLAGEERSIVAGTERYGLNGQELVKE